MASRRLTPSVLLRPLRERHGLPMRYHNLFFTLPRGSSVIDSLSPS
jgi:hypothetical protein